MQLIGMLDSPYVRRVAITLQLLGLPFEHRSVSVFRGFAQFAAINPVVKAPTLVCDDGTILMDSNLIIDYAEALAATQNQARKSLMPARIADRQHALRVLGLALAACEKSVQIVYEHGVRPPEKLHQPWVDRVTGQLRAACGALEAELARRPLFATSETIDQAGLTTAIVWHFIQALTTAEAAPAGDYPLLQRHSQAAEQLPEFIAAPHGEGVYRAT
ncbi:MAG: glutathione S-transferase [Burkholderiales bacterium]